MSLLGPRQRLSHITPSLQKLAVFFYGHYFFAWDIVMPSHPRTWDDGVNDLRVSHLLFGVESFGKWPARFLRCGTNRYFGRD
jgi:hypothetical protein